MRRYGSYGKPNYTDDYLGPLSNCTGFSGSMPGLAENLIYEYNNTNQTFGRKPFLMQTTSLLLVIAATHMLLKQQYLQQNMACVPKSSYTA